MRKCRHCRNELPSVKESNPMQRAGFCNPLCLAQNVSQKRDAKPLKAPTAKAKKKPKSIAVLREECAVLLQKLVRMKAADDNGYCKCWTCEKSYHWKEMQGGHFIERGKTATKLVEENIHPQCSGCNLYAMKKASTILDYRAAMVDYYGEDFVRNLEAESKKVVKHTREYLEGLIAQYSEQIKEAERGIS